MNDKKEKIIHDIKIPGLNHHENYVLTHKCFNTYMDLIFSDESEAHVYQMPYRKSKHHGIESLKNFNCFDMSKPDEHLEDYHLRKPNDENFRFEVGDKKYIYKAEKLISFATNDIIVKYNSEHGFNVIKFHYAYGEENLCILLHQKYIPIRDFENSSKK